MQKYSIMQKILVPTDFSTNSKVGIRFAIHWAAQQKTALAFIYVLHILRPTTWSDSYFEKYAEAEGKNCRVKLGKFITQIYKTMNLKPDNYSLVVTEGISADISILDYCRDKTEIDYICISTRGAGKFKKIFGTNTGNLITKSHIPVMAIPNNYKHAGLNSIMYATDFHNYAEEIKKVVAFAKPLKAKVEVLHFAWPNTIVFDVPIIEAVFKKQFKYNLKVHLVKTNATHSLVEKLQEQIKTEKPSVVIMFTEQNRTFFQKLFLGSKSEELSFEAKVPLLVFNKNYAD